MHLRPTRYAWFDQVPRSPERHLPAQEVEELGALWAWPYDAHLTTYDIPELRALIQPGLAQEGPDAGHAQIVFCRPHSLAVLLRRCRHRPKLEDLERLAAFAQSDLPEDNWPWPRTPYQQREHRDERCDQSESESCERQVENPLRDPGVGPLVEVQQAHKPRGTDVLDGYLSERVLIELEKPDHTKIRGA